MPFTPFHFGVGAGVHSAAPRHVSFLAFCAANVVVDFETLYYLTTGQFPYHRFFHSFAGMSFVIAATIGLFAAALWLATKVELPNLFGWQQLTMMPISVGAGLGGYTHVVLDSIMHSEIRPFAPFDDSNPFFGIVRLDVLHWSCVAAGVAGLAVLGIRELMKERNGSR
jgi:membrane-bound metal-dependent hydrolase YbcI (DUF457 family)